MASDTARNVTHKHIRTATLDVAYEEGGNPGGTPVLLMHGWPYDPRCYDDVVPRLVAAGCRVIVPYLRGFGATRFLSAESREVNRRQFHSGVRRGRRLHI